MLPLLFLPLFPLLTTASPVDKRACAVEYPLYTTIIDTAGPDFISNPDGTNHWTTVARYPVNNTIRHMDTILTFATPPGSWGCQLELYFDTGFPSLFPVWTNYPNYGPAKADVWNIDTPPSYQVTWNTAPQPVNLFGTTGEIPVASSGVVAVGFKRVVNSAGCRAKMSYRVKVPEELAEGGVTFNARAPVDSAAPFGGWRMVHNC